LNQGSIGQTTAYDQAGVVSSNFSEPLGTGNNMGATSTGSFTNDVAHPKTRY